MEDMKGAWYSSKPHSRDHEVDAKKALIEADQRRRNSMARQMGKTGAQVEADRLQKRVDMDLFK
jgi:hypothetical protein